MLNWYKDRVLPDTLRIDSGRVLNDVKFYVDLHCGWITSVPVYSLTYKLAYYRLYVVKKIIQKDEKN